MRIKVDFAEISFTKDSSKGTFDAGVEDVTAQLAGEYINIRELLKRVNDSTGFSPFEEDYSYVHGAEDVIYTSELFNEDFDFPTDDEFMDYEAGKINLYNGTLAINIQVEKFDYPDANDMKELGIRQM